MLSQRSSRYREHVLHMQNEFRRRMVDLGRSGRSPYELSKEFEPPVTNDLNYEAVAYR